MGFSLVPLVPPMSAIKLADITADQRAQPRTSILVDKVSEYTEDMERGDKFPPLIVFREGDRYWLADGFHRYYAATAANFVTIECHIKDGTLRDAILFSCSANAAHGLRRTNDDKRRAAAKLLEDEEWSKWSDSEISRICAVSHVFVAKVRKEVAAFKPAGSPETITGEERTYRTKHGTEAKMKVKGQPPAPIDGSVVAKWLHEIEQRLDKMPPAAEAVASFPPDQHYLFPVSKLEAMALWMADFAAAWRLGMEAKAHERAG